MNWRAGSWLPMNVMDTHGIRMFVLPIDSVTTVMKGEFVNVCVYSGVEITRLFWYVRWSSSIYANEA
jgi:hypothetical protein